MGWTGFVARMKDGNMFGFGTTFSFEFFDMPENYCVDDIVEIINHSYISESGELCSHKAPWHSLAEIPRAGKVYRERPFFECYVDEL